jgi:predicted GIY-YIG superfamily endonuclease
MTTAIPDGPTALYRFFDTAGRLLYVGITVDIGVRWKHHSKGKEWWADVVRATVTHYPTRDAALAAEKAAIRAEKPIWNIIHNQRAATTLAPRQEPQRLLNPTPVPSWTFESLRTGYQRTTPLYLYWELDGDPITDDYLPEEISAEELWDMWRRDYPHDQDAEPIFGKGAYRIWWYVTGGGAFEGAPFQDLRGVRYPGGHFLKAYTWPEDAETGERLRWGSLPVVDKVWRPDRGDKGGFIQEITGWKPSPLQPYINIAQLVAMSGRYDRWTK